jgi:hypothetical protein
MAGFGGGLMQLIACGLQEPFLFDIRYDYDWIYDNKTFTRRKYSNFELLDNNSMVYNNDKLLYFYAFLNYHDKSLLHLLGNKVEKDFIDMCNSIDD